MLYNRAIQGDSIILRSAQMVDLEFTFEIRQDKEKTKYMHSIGESIETQRKWLEKQIARPGDYFFIVYDKKDNRIGTCSVYNVNISKKEAEIGRNLLCGTPIQNLEALTLIHEFAFYELNLEKLHVKILSENISSVGVTIRMGGEEVGREYNEEFQMDMIYYIIKKEEYEKEQGKLKELINRFTRRT